MRLVILSPLALSICLVSPLAAAGRPRKAEPATPPAAPALPVEATFLKPLKARAIGPAVMGGRISDLAVDPSNPFTCYVGLAHGGVMKTTDAGASFQPVFDKTGVASIGALAVSPADPKVVWAGTGEANDRNSSGWGKGVFRGTDGGATWTKLTKGLPAGTGRIGLAVSASRPAGSRAWPTWRPRPTGPDPTRPWSIAPQMGGGPGRTWARACPRISRPMW